METKNIYLAPMDNINDIAFRMLCKQAGAKRTYTSMIQPASRKRLFLPDKPVIQLICRDNQGIDEFMKKFDAQSSGWNLNLGCPGQRAQTDGFGAFLQNIEIIDQILSTMRSLTNKSLSVKLRKTSNINSIIKVANRYCDEIIIHPRSIQQAYTGLPDIKYALSLKKHTDLPLIYSGNVDEANCHKLLKQFAGVVVGRRAIGDPEIFARLNNRQQKINFLGYLRFAQKYQLPLLQIKYQAINFMHKIPGGERYLFRLLQAKTPQRLAEIFTYTYQHLSSGSDKQ